MNGYFVISLDCELIWGVQDKDSIIVKSLIHQKLMIWDYYWRRIFNESK